MRKITTWMMLMAMAVSPMLAQEPETSVTDEEQQIDQAIEEAIGTEAPAEVEPVEAEPAEPEPAEPVPAEPEPVAAEPAEPEPPQEPAYVEEAQVPQEPETVTEEDYDERDYEDDRESHQERDSYQDRRPERREVQTLMSGSGGFGAISIGYTEINQTPALNMGARAEWVIGHGFGLGIAAEGFTTDLQPDGDFLVGDYLVGVSGGYAGLVMEPIILGWFPVHIALPVLIGAGGVTSYSTPADLWEYGDFDPYFQDYGVFFVAEVGAELEFNLVRAVRLSLFGTYRFTPDLNMKPMYGPEPDTPYDSFVRPDALKSWSAGVRFKFGKF